MAFRPLFSSGLGPCLVDTQIARQTLLSGLFEEVSDVALHPVNSKLAEIPFKT